MRKINTLLRLLIVGLLIYPMPIGMAQEVTVNEGFEDSTYEAGLTVSGGTNYCDEQNQYGTTGCSLLLSNGTYTFTFSSDIYVYEVGFIVGAVNNAYSVKYYYSDGTDETINKSGQDISNYSTMYDNFYKSFTDYNNSNEISSEIYITKFDVVVSDPSLFDTLYWQYDDADATGSFATTTTTTSTTTTTTTIPRTIGTPTDVSVKFDTVNNQDGFLVSWSAPTDGGYSPERYAVFFGEGECCQYAVATGNVGDENALNTYSFFSMDYLTNVFGSQYGDFYWKIRSDNDTEALYSGWSETVHMNSTPPTTTTSTTTTTLPPPPPTTTTTTLPPTVEIIMDDGSTAEYTQTEVADGTVERDNERKANEEKWGCYVTNIALQRGDCEAYNEALKTEEEVVDDIIIVEEKDEEIIDTKPDIVDEEIVEDGLESIETDPLLSEEGDKEVQSEELVEEKDEVKITTTTTVPKITTTTTQPIKEDFVDEDIVEEEIVDIEVIISEEPTEEKVEVLVKETEDKVKEVVIIEVDEDDTEEKVAEKITEAVKLLPTEKKVEVVKEVAKVKVQNLVTADTTTKEVVKAVVKEVTKTETVAQLSKEEKKDVGKVLGFQDETAADDVEIIAVQAEKEPAIAEAVAEYVDRAIENKDVENYTLADVITEIQVEAFLDNPIGSLFDVRIDELDISSLGDDMTSDQKEKAQEVVVPVILASQIISSAGALMRRF